MKVLNIHQIFFDFGHHRQLEDIPLFSASYRAFKGMHEWAYRLWDEDSVEQLCKARYPDLWDTYQGLKYPIMRVDLAKYMILDAHGGIYADLDVLPACHVNEIVDDRPYLFDRCSRPHVIANDLCYVGPDGLPGIVEDFLANVRRVNSIPI